MIKEILHSLKEYLVLIRLKQQWRSENSHNFSKLGRRVEIDKISVGCGTYGTLHVMSFGQTDGSLSIGNYCSIASNVTFLLGGNHALDNISTYPFKHYFFRGTDYCEAISKGDIVIADDVWIGVNATILSGVNVGQGAVITAGAVVVSDVPPYAVVGGVPAKVLKYRFSADIIADAVKIDFSKLDPNDISMEQHLYGPVDSDKVSGLRQKLNQQLNG